jgi:hypothetical protein
MSATCTSTITVPNVKSEIDLTKRLAKAVSIAVSACNVRASAMCPVWREITRAPDAQERFARARCGARALSDQPFTTAPVDSVTW